MLLINKLKKADFTRKTELWHDANMTCCEANELVKEMVLSLPKGTYRLHGRNYGTNLVDAIYEAYGWMPSMLVDEPMILGLQVLHRKKIYASFTLGLDVVVIL